MTGEVSTVLDTRATIPPGLPHLLKWSFAVHLTLAAIVLGWQAWTAHVAETSRPMTINLSGAVGPTTSGLTPLGGRQVDQATPEPKRPTPIPAVVPKPEDSSVTTTKAPAKPATPKAASAPPSSVVSTPATGRQVATGSSVVETGSRGEGSGLAQGAGGAHGAVSDPEFEKCCREYLNTLETQVTQRVNWKQDAHGNVVIRFVIQKDGSIPLSSIQVEQKASNLLNLDAQNAIRTTKLPPLPAAYAGQQLTVHLTIPY